MAESEELMNKNPEEQQKLARELGQDLTEMFAQFVRGEIEFADLTFETFQTLQDLHIIASGEYELQMDTDEDYDLEEATEEQEDLAQEPSRPD